MNIYMLIKTILTTLLLTLFISACSSNTDSNIKEKQVNAKSGERVDLVALDGDSYSWSQISGTSVVLINANTDTLSFIAPDVNKTESLVFEVQVISDNGDIKKESITVTVHPLEVLEDNEKTPTDTTSSNDNNITNSTPQTDSNKTSISTSPLKSITLTISNNSLNINTSATLNAIATYEDKTTKDVTEEVEWIASDLNAIEISKNQITAKKEKNITLQAKLNAITSNTIALEIYREINGHRLPPEPDEKFNTSTLIGVDLNSNGVRDDVERKILIEIPTELKKQAYLQAAKDMQILLADPNILETAQKEKEGGEESSDRYFGCKSYIFWTYDIKISNSIKFLEEATFNTKERILKYARYNNALGGGVYWTEEKYKVESSCDFNITKALEMDQ